MTALLEQIEADGIRLTVTESGEVRIAGKRSLVERWAPTLRDRKPDLMAALLAREHVNMVNIIPCGNRAARTMPPTDAHSRWRLPDGRTLWVSPPETLEQVQGRHPCAVRWTNTDTDTVTVTELPPEEVATIRAWLASVGEPLTAIEQDIETARHFPDTAAWLLARAHIDVTARAILHTCGDCQHFTHDPEGGGGIGTCAITKAGHPPKDATGYPLCYPFAQRRCPDFETAKEAGKLA